LAVQWRIQDKFSTEQNNACRPGALQAGSTGISFTTWDRSTVGLPDKPPHVGMRSLVVSTCDPLLNRNWSFHGAVGRRSAAGLFRWQVRQSGMHYRTVSEIQSWL